MNKVPWSIARIYFFGRGILYRIHNFIIPLYKKKNDHRVFCIGDVKTGTSTLAKALSILGYRSIQWIQVSKPKNGWIQYLKKSNFDAFSDHPMYENGLYKELDKAFPDCKFILTIRDTKSWVKSYNNYFKDSPWEITNPKTMENRIKEYEKRNNDIIEYFKDRPSRLLILNLMNGDGWNNLCNFLNKPIPDKPFPHKNKGKYNKKPNMAN